MRPAVFGPCVTPRQKPEGGRWVYDAPTKTTHYKVVYEVPAEKLQEILPEKYELLSPHIVVTFSALRNIAWLQGGGYDIVVANIVADVIMGLSGSARGFLKPGGLFLCSGIIDDRAQEVLDKLKADGWDVIEQRQSEGWYSFLCR